MKISSITFTILKELANVFLGFWQIKKTSSKMSVGKESSFDITKLANKTIYSDVWYFKEKVTWPGMKRLNETRQPKRQETLTILLIINWFCLAPCYILNLVTDLMDSVVNSKINYKIICYKINSTALLLTSLEYCFFIVALFSKANN